MPDVLRLEVREFTDLTRWCWTLTDGTGAFLADHDVRLDPSAEHFDAFTDLPGYTWHAAPDRYLADEARIVTSLGDWIGSQIFGDAIGGKLIKRHPATVEVIIPKGAEALACLPLKAARVQGRSLAGHDITLIMQPDTAAAPAKTKVTDRLRVLGLFSLPEGGNPLNLRRERHTLVKLLRGIAAAGRAADVKVLQYGVTRDRLRDVLEEAEGWDIIHVSGHGAPGEPHLRDRDRRPRPHHRRRPGALSAAEQRRLFHLPVSEDQHHNHPERPKPSPPARSSAPGTLVHLDSPPSLK